MSNTNKWIDLRMLLSEIRFHRSSNKNKIGQLRANGKELLHKLSLRDYYGLCTYLESVGSEQILETLQTWAEDFAFEDNDVLNFMNEGQPSPKFQVGDWVVLRKDNHRVSHPVQIVDIQDQEGKYILSDGRIYSFEGDSGFSLSLWSIDQAERGDVLTATGPRSTCTFILFRFYDNDSEELVVDGYCCIECRCENNNVELYPVSPSQLPVNHVNIHPADDIHQLILKNKMAEAGLAWDAQKQTVVQYIDTNQDPQ